MYYHSLECVGGHLSHLLEPSGLAHPCRKLSPTSFLDLFTAALRNCILPSLFKLWSVLNLTVCLSQLGNEASSVWNFCTRFSFFDLISSLGNQWCRREMAVFWRLVFTSDRVVVGVVRALMTQWNSNTGVVRGVLSATESESEESERFHFLRPRLRLRRLSFAYDLVKTRLSEAEAES